MSINRTNKEVLDKLRGLVRSDQFVGLRNITNVIYSAIKTFD